MTRLRGKPVVDDSGEVPSAEKFRDVAVNRGEAVIVIGCALEQLGRECKPESR